MPFRWKQTKGFNIANIVWREDMDTLVLEILRESVLRVLADFAQSHRDNIRRCKSLDDVSKHRKRQVAALLWLGSESDATGREDSVNKDGAPASTAVGSGPLPYAMHHLGSHYIPVYNLPQLLGPTKMRTVRENDSLHFGDEYAIIIAGRFTIALQSDLWKLQGYLA